MTEQPDAAAAAPRTRVLVVDDARDDAVALSFEIGRGLKDIDTRWAEGGEQMYAAITSWQPHIVLTDVHMPRFDIFEALERLRTQWPLLPVVVVSGLVGEEMAARLIKAGAKDFVAKSGVARLALVVERELREARERAEKQALATQLRNQERLFLQVLEHLPVGVWVLDAAGTIHHRNPAVKAIWEGERHVGTDRYSHYKGWWAETGLPVDASEWGAARAISDGEASFDQRIEIETFTGKRKVILNSALPLHGDDGALLGCFIVNQDITELHQTEQRLQHTQSMLRALSQRLLDVQEEERRWIAQELHDDIGQGIAAMRIQLARIADRSQEPAAREMAANALRSSDQLTDRLRQICLGLRPLELDDFGVMAALRSVVASLGSRPALDLQLHCEGPERRYPAALETAAFRIAQEAINNTLRHSGCSSLHILVQADLTRLLVSVTDDGCGFSVDTATSAETRARHLGLTGMDERARAQGGKLEIESQPGRGTRVAVAFDTSPDTTSKGP